MSVVNPITLSTNIEKAEVLGDFLSNIETNINFNPNPNPNAWYRKSISTVVRCAGAKVDSCLFILYTVVGR